MQRTIVSRHWTQSKSCLTGMAAATILQGTLEGGRRLGRSAEDLLDGQRLCPCQYLLTMASRRTDWKMISADSFFMSPR